MSFGSRLLRYLVALIAGSFLVGCGSAAPARPSVIAFPNAINLPTIPLTDRVVNLNTKSGFQYVKLSLGVVFADEKGQWAKAKGEGLKKLNETFLSDHAAAVNAFNDVLTMDLSSKTPDELQSPNGKEMLRRQLIQDFNARLAGPPPVIWINFTDFVMQ